MANPVSFSGVSNAQGSDFTPCTLNDLPTIPAYATLNSVVLTFDANRTGGGANAEIFVTCSGHKLRLYEDFPKNSTKPLSINLCATAAGSLISHNKATGTLTYIDGSKTLGIKVYHDYWLFGASKWTISNIKITANYTVPTYTITWKNYDGTVLETDTVTAGTTPTYNGATPTKPSTDRNDFGFTGWSPSVAIATANATYTAQFDITAIRYKLTTKCEPEGAATTEGDGFYAANTTVKLKAIVGEDSDRWSWVGWKNTYNDTINDSIYVNISTRAADVTYTAMFEERLITISTGCIDTFGTVTGGGDYTYGSTVTLTATPNPGFKFVGWSDGETSATRTITVTTDKNYYAEFERLKYTITFKDGDGSILEVVETEYNIHPKWSKTPTKESTAEYTYNFTGGWIPPLTGATQDQTYEPYFDAVKRSYTITANSNNNDYGSVSGSGTYEYGTTVTLVATPSSGYRFVQWNDGDTNASRKVTITGTATYTAIFEKSTQVYSGNSLTSPYSGNEKTTVYVGTTKI